MVVELLVIMSNEYIRNLKSMQIKSIRDLL